MNYQEALTYIHNRKAHSAKPGLHRIKALMELLGNPQKGLPFLHIAGTNGKGSTATMLANVLHHAGYKTGCFTSPFIYDFRERFAIDGALIAEDTLAALAERVKEAEQSLPEPLTEFEVVTAIGFLYFKEEHCDIVVLEVGLGGRFDATNIIERPLASIICSISRDHTEFLGNTIEEIAFEKAGIIKEGCPIILYHRNPEAAIKVIREQAAAKNAPLILGSEPQQLRCDAAGNAFRYRGEEYTLQLRGAHQIGNAVTVLEALFFLKKSGKIQFTESQLKIGLHRAMIDARLQKIWDQPPIYIDGGHNQEGIEALIHAIDSIEELKEPIIIFSMMRDKPYQYAAQQLGLRAKAMLCIQPPLPRAMTAFDLCNIADLFCEDCVACDSYEQAAKLALEKAEGHAIIAAGSLYSAGDMANTLKNLLR